MWTTDNNSLKKLFKFFKLLALLTKLSLNFTSLPALIFCSCVNIVYAKCTIEIKKKRICTISLFQPVLISSTASTFTDNTHSLGSKRRYVTPLIPSSHDEGVVSYFLSHRSKTVTSRKILIDHWCSIRPSPSAVAILTTNKPSISVISS